MQKSKAFGECDCNADAIALAKRRAHVSVGELDAGHTGHDSVLPAEDVAVRIDPVGPGNGDGRALVDHVHDVALSLQLTRMGLTAQRVATAGGCDQDNLPE